MKEIIVPGDKIEGKADSYVFKDGNSTYSMVLGILDRGDKFVKISPLTGKYYPAIGDTVVGVVTEEKKGGYIVDINSPYDAFLMSRKRYHEGDVVLAEVKDVSEVRSVLLSYDNPLDGGELTEISSMKVPRVIGKQNSMLMLIKEKTKTDIYVGRNGRIWLKGGDIVKAQKTILKIEREAHTDGLTDRINEFLNKVI
jgi:exosome complex component RRP4